MTCFETATLIAHVVSRPLNPEQADTPEVKLNALCPRVGSAPGGRLALHPGFAAATACATGAGILAMAITPHGQARLSPPREQPPARKTPARIARWQQRPARTGPPQMPGPCPRHCQPAACSSGPARRRLGQAPLLLLVLLAMIPLAGCSSSPLRSGERSQLAGRTYVVTGASSGIGRGVALALGRARANVVLAARGTAGLQSVAAQIEAAGGTALVVTTDVSWPEDVARLARAALLRFGRIDVWINNAGVGLIGRFEDIPVQHHARVIDVNLKGVIYGSHAALAQFRQQGGGTLVNVGSVESEVPLAYQASYAASKHAVLALGRALNEELRLAGQKQTAVATVMPFATDTPLYSHIANFSGHTPRSLLLDDPQKVVNVILHAALHPREEMPVGWKGKLSYHAHRLFDDLTEWLTATLYHQQQMERAPAAPATTGNLYSPSPGSGAVMGGTRARIRQEEAARAQPMAP